MSDRKDVSEDNNDTPNSTRVELAEKRSDFARQRTEWAEHRTLLANERTFSAWLRTGLASIGGGFAVARLVQGESFGLLPRIAGLLLVVVGVTVFLLAFWRYNRITDVLEMEEGLPITPRWVTSGLVGLLLLIALLVLIPILV